MKIKYGTTRIVILTEHFAIKIPYFLYTWKRFLQGMVSNLSEQEISSWNLKIHENKLCPVLFGFAGIFIVMPKCEPLQSFSAEQFETFVFDTPMASHIEDKSDSFGLYNGRIVAVDYGTQVWATNGNTKL